MPARRSAQPRRVRGVLTGPRITVRLDFPGGRQLGHGKIRLLETIDRLGSISSAARDMKMSYRRAWLLMDEVNSMFREPVLETQLGGKGGGHAKLTDFGKSLIELYRGVEKHADVKFEAAMKTLENKLAPPAD